jgi:hypothetical protein
MRLHGPGFRSRLLIRAGMLRWRRELRQSRMAANDRDALQGRETCDAGHTIGAFRPKSLKSNKRTGLVTPE